MAAARTAVRLRGMEPRPPRQLAFNLRTLFAMSAIVAIVGAGPSLVRLLGPVSGLVALLLFGLVVFIATGSKWPDGLRPCIPFG